MCHPGLLLQTSAAVAVVTYYQNLLPSFSACQTLPTEHMHVVELKGIVEQGFASRCNCKQIPAESEALKLLPPGAMDLAAATKTSSTLVVQCQVSTCFAMPCLQWKVRCFWSKLYLSLSARDLPSKHDTAAHVLCGRVREQHLLQRA